MTRLFKILLVASLITGGTFATADVWAENTTGTLKSAVQNAQAVGVSESDINRILAMAYERQIDPAETANYLHIMTFI